MSRARFASAFAAGSDWSSVLEQALRQLPRIRTAGANLGFLYLSDQFNDYIAPILSRLREATGVEHWVGASGVGVIGDRGAEMDNPAISIMLGQFPADSFRVFSGRSPLPRDFAAYGALIHADPRTPDMGELVQDMATRVRAATLVGGMASARDTAWQIADAPLTGGLSGAAFDSRVRLLTGVSQSCVALPGSWRVTEANDNLIDKIDGRPALDIFREAIGPARGADLRHAIRNVQVGLTSGPEDRRLFAVRYIVAADVRTGRIAINDNLTAGQHLVFVQQDEHSAREDLHNMLVELREACPSEPRGALYVSCLGRGGAMFERDQTEIEMIAEVFGDLPLAGFFAAGEIVGARVLGYTGALTLIL